MSISEEESKRLGALATAHHPLAVHAMAKASTKIPRGYSVTSATVTAVRKGNCDLSIALCQGELCMTKTSTYRFSPPLSDRPERSLGARLAAIRKEVCTPDPTWLFRDPLALLILVVCGLIAIGTFGVDLVEFLAGAPKLESTIVSLFGSSATFATAVSMAFWFTVLAHAFEAVLAVRYARNNFGLGVASTAKWGFLVFLVGYPIFSRLQALVAIQHRHAKSK